LHVILVLKPDIVTLLSTKYSNGSADDDCSNDDDCQQTGRETDGLCSAQSKDAGLSITVADLALIDRGSWNLIDVAAVSQSCAVCSVTSSLLGVDCRGQQRRAVCDWELTSQDGVAGVVRAGVTIVAGDVCVDATDGWIAGVVCAHVVVVALEGHVERRVKAARQRIAIVVSAGVAVIAVDR